MSASEAGDSSEAMLLVLREIRDLKRESQKYFQSAEKDRRQAAGDRKLMYEALAAFAKSQSETAAMLSRFGDRLDRNTGVLEEIRDLLRRGFNGHKPGGGHGHGKR